MLAPPSKKFAVVAVLLGGVHGRGAGETEARNRVPLRVGAHPGAGSGGRDGRHEALDTGPCIRPLLRFIPDLIGAGSSARPNSAAFPGQDGLTGCLCVKLY